MKAPAGGDDNVDVSPALKKQSKSRPGVRGASQQAQTHSSGGESLNPSLSFKPVCRTPKPPLLAPRRNAAQPEVDDTREKEQQLDFSGVCKETDTHTSVSLNRQGSAQDPIDLDCEETEKDATKVKLGLDSSKSRKRKHLPSKGSSPESSKGDESVHQSEEDCTKKKGYDVDIEPGEQNPLATSMEEARSIVHVTSAEEVNNSSQVMLGPSLPDHEAASSHENRAIVDGPAITGCSKQAPQEQNQKVGSSVDTPKTGMEDCSTIIPGRGQKRKHEAMTPPTLPSSRCQNCQGTSAGEGTSERLNWVTPQSRKFHNDVDAGFSRQRRHGWCRGCKEAHPSSAPCSSPGSDMDRTYWPSKRPRLKEWESEEDYSWLDTYTHVVPQALTKLASAMRKASFSFSDFGIFLEFGASVNDAKCKLGCRPHHREQ